MGGMLQVGEMVEPFTLVDNVGVKREITRGSYKIIFFFPKANTPG